MFYLIVFFRRTALFCFGEHRTKNPNCGTMKYTIGVDYEAESSWGGRIGEEIGKGMVGKQLAILNLVN